MRATGNWAQGRKVTVIGAGIIGISSALNLQRAGFDVTVIDKEPPGEGASSGNAGIMAPCAFVPVPTPGIVWKAPGMLLDPMGPLSVRWSYLPRMLPWLMRYLRNSSAKRVEKIAAALATLADGSVEEHQALANGSDAEQWLRPATYAYVYESEEDFKKESFAWNLRRKHGIKINILRNGEVQDMEPSIGEVYKFAITLDHHGYVRDPEQLVKSLARELKRAGGHVLHRKVRDIEIGPEGPTQLVTDQGNLDLDILVVAAGAWSGKLASRLGSPVPLETERGYHVVLTDPGISPKVAIMSSKGKFVATPMTMGLRIAGLVEFGGLEAPPNYACARTLLKHAELLFPGVNTKDFTEWMGHRPALPDSLPVIGRSPHFENVYFAFGHQHIGLSTGPKTGRLIADLVSGRTPNIDIDPFGVERFNS